MSKTAVILFNLGGPDGPDAVQPFLFNLFNDKAIIGLPGPLRWMIAKLISSRRAPVAQEIYAQIGGRSPILAQTESQAAALQERLGSSDEFRVFTVMRYWHPRAETVAADVKSYAPDQVLLLPLYPQFSTTTTGSSFDEWRSVASKIALSTPTRLICCYPTQSGWVRGQTHLLQETIRNAGLEAGYKVLFSAHGLPEKTIAAGDPYQWQVEQSAAALAAAAALDPANWQVCYQSRVGPMKWIGPSLDDALVQAASEEKSVVILPIAFVSEHSETLVELDHEYAARAAELGIKAYHRVPALGTTADFIDGLADMVRSADVGTVEIAPDAGGRRCPAEWPGCLCRLTSNSTGEI